MSINRTIALFFVIFISAMMLNGCGGDDMQDLHDYVAQLQQVKTKELAALKKNPPTVKLQFPAATVYQAQALRQPFESPDVVAGGGKGVGPLQAVPLNMLRFVGTISQEGATTAYVLTPDNMIFQVKKGDILGQHYGKIISISPYEITVLEQDVQNGKATNNVVALQLRENR